MVDDLELAVRHRPPGYVPRNLVVDEAADSIMPYEFNTTARSVAFACRVFELIMVLTLISADHEDSLCTSLPRV